MSEILHRMLADARHWQPPAPQRDVGEWEAEVGEYRRTDRALIHLTLARDGQEISRPLTNFPARIAREIALDDGAEIRRSFEIVALVRNRRIEVTVPAHQFAGMSWVLPQLGAGAIMAPGPAVKERIGHALQTLAPDAQAVVYAHAGWRRVGAEWAYLHGAGGLGASGPVPDVETSLELVELAQCALSCPPAKDRPRCMREALALVRATVPDRIALPLFASVWLALAGGGPFALYLVGGSGTRKSAVASVLQQFWGRDNHRLAGLNATRNGIERYLHGGKDMLTILDDAAPGGSDHDTDKVLALVEGVVRAIGNGQARRKSSIDGSLQVERPSRGQVLMTGEMLPRGFSIIARLLVIEFQPSDVRLPALSQLQEAAGRGVLADALAAVVVWMAARHDQVIERFRTLLDDYRIQMRQEETSAHGRSTDAAAYLMAALSAIFCPAAVDGGAMSEAEAGQLLADTHAVLREVRDGQAAEQAEEHPVIRSLRLIRSALAAGRAVIGNRTDPGHRPAVDDPSAYGWKKAAGDWQHVGAVIGFTDVELVIYLEPETFFSSLCSEAQRQGRALGLSARQLYKRFREAGALARTDRGRSTVKVRIGTRNPANYLALNANTIFDDEALAHLFPNGNGNGEKMGTEYANDLNGLPGVPGVPVSAHPMPGRYTSEIDRARGFFAAVLAIADAQGWSEFTGDEMAGAIKAAGPRDWWPVHQHLTSRTFSDLVRAYAPTGMSIETHQRWRAGANVKAYPRVAFETAYNTINATSSFSDPSLSPDGAADAPGDTLEYNEKHRNASQIGTNPSVSPSVSLETSLENGSTAAGYARNSADDDGDLEGEI